MKRHSWTDTDDKLLLQMVSVCKPLFQHSKVHKSSYSEQLAWSAVAGRMLPSVCVTGEACRRRFSRLRKEQGIGNWDSLVERVEDIERGLLEGVYDCVRAVEVKLDGLSEALAALNVEVECLKDLWR